MLFPKVLILFSQYLIFVRTSYLRDQLASKAIKIDRFDGKFCGTKVPMEFSYIGLKCNTTSLFAANSTVIIKENLAVKPMMTISIRRCKSKENLDSCEDFHELQNIDYCETINPDALLERSPAAIAYQPKYKCPIKKGVYHAYNFTVNLTPFLFFKLDGWYWRTQINIVSPNQNKLLACLNVEAYTVLK